MRPLRLALGLTFVVSPKRIGVDMLIYIQGQKETARSAIAVLPDVVHIGCSVFMHMTLHMAQGGMACLAALEKDASSRRHLQNKIHTRAHRYDLPVYVFYVVSMLEGRPHQRNSTNASQR